MFEGSRSVRVLLVEANANVGTPSACIHRLSSRGHRPLLVEHWTEALQLAHERKVDAALIELRAFETAGVECVRALSYANAGLPLMGLVNRTQRVDEVNLSLLDAVLMKPLDVDAFEKAFDFARNVRSRANGVSSEVRLRSAPGVHRFRRELRKQA